MALRVSGSCCHLEYDFQVSRAKGIPGGVPWIAIVSVRSQWIGGHRMGPEGAGGGRVPACRRRAGALARKTEPANQAVRVELGASPGGSSALGDDLSGILVERSCLR